MFPKKMLTFEYKFEFSLTLWQLVLIFKGPCIQFIAFMEEGYLHYISLHYFTLHYIKDVNIYVQNDNNNQEYIC